MDIGEYIRRQVAGAHRLLDAAINDTAPEMVNAKVAEHCNTIAAVYAHVVSGEDYFVQTAIQGKPRLWEGRWSERLGIPQTIGRDWSVQIPDLAAFREYAKAVHAATDEYLTRVTPAELDRVVKVFGNDRPVATALIVLVTHTAGHGGEIAALKGFQGVKGLPF